MIITEDIGNRIRDLRKQRKLSQEKLAEALGIYQADVSNLERAMGGSGIADLFRLDAIADYFGVPIEYLLTGRGIEPRLPVAEKSDLFQADYSNLSEVYRYRAMVEAWIKNPSAYDTVEDYEHKEKAILEKLKKACLSDEAYSVWKKDYIDAKVKEVSSKTKIFACEYLFAGIGQFTEYVPESEIEMLKAMIQGAGSAFLGDVREATDQEIRVFVELHLADELFDNQSAVEDKEYYEK